MPSANSALDTVPVSEPPRAVKEHCLCADEKALPAVCAVLESLMSISRLRGHAHLAAEIDTADCPDLSSPAAILSMMNERLSVPVSYLAALPCVREVVNAHVNVTDLVAAAARSSSRLTLLYNTHGEACVAILPHATPRSRCTLHIQNIHEFVTVSHIQRAIPRHLVLHVCRPSPDSAFVTFEDAPTAKNAFVDLQKKPIGSCTSVQVKMRVELDTHPFGAPRPNAARENAISNARPHGAAPRAVGEVDAVRSVFPAARRAPAPISPIDVHLTGNTKAEKSFLRMSGAVRTNAAGHFAAQPRAGRWRGDVDRIQRAMCAAVVREHTMIPQSRPPWEASTAAAAVGGALPRMCRGDGALGGMCPPFPVDAAAPLVHCAPIPPAETIPATLCGEGGALLSHGAANVAVVVRRRRLQHDPYKGDIYFESVEGGAGTQWETPRAPPTPPKELLNRKLCPLNCLGLPSAHAKETAAAAGNSSDEEERSADLTPNETSSTSPSDGGESFRTPHMTYADVIRAARVPECPLQSNQQPPQPHQQQ